MVIISGTLMSTQNFGLIAFNTNKNIYVILI